MTGNTTHAAAGMLIAVALLGASGTTAIAATAVQGLDQNRAVLLADVNAYRAAHGLSELVENVQLDAESQRWARRWAGAPAEVSSVQRATSAVEDELAEGMDVDDAAAAAADADDDAVGGMLFGVGCVAAAYGLDIAVLPAWASMLGDPRITDVGLGYAYDADGYAVEAISAAAPHSTRSARTAPAMRAVHVEDDRWTVGPLGGRIGRPSPSGPAATTDPTGEADADAEGATGASQDVTPHVGRAPTKAEGLHVRRIGRTITIRFRAVPGAQRYRVVARWSGGRRASAGASTTFRLRDVPTRSRLIVTVRATNATGSSLVRLVLPARR